MVPKKLNPAPKDIAQAVAQTELQLSKAISRLESSLKKTESLGTDPRTLGDEQLEQWESLLARFARAVDLFSSKYLRLKVLLEEPGFRGSPRDLLNQAEKQGVIDSAERWFELKELRNRQAHDYEDEALQGLFKAIREESKYVLLLKPRFKSP